MESKSLLSVQKDKLDSNVSIKDRNLIGQPCVIVDHLWDVKSFFTQNSKTSV